MLDHLSLGTRDLARAAALLDAALAPLGFVRVWTTPDAIGWGPPGADDRLAVKLRPGFAPPGSGFHLAITATSREQVDAFHRAALLQGARDHGAPGPRPQYGEGYYAGFVVDHDGHVLEAVFHEGARESTATLALHADDGLEPSADVAPPIHVSTTFEAENREGLVYAREDTATRRRLEAVLSALEGGHAVTFASGQAAAFAALLRLRPARVLIARDGYHATHAALAALGIPEAPLETEPAAGDLAWLETPKNPTLAIEDIAGHAARARAAGARLLVDSTFATPVLQSPLALGADLVMHSATKFLSGHSDALGGVLVARDEDLARELRQARTVSGAVMGALEAWLTLRGLRTLALRVERQCETAARLASFLAARAPRVWHPSRPDHPGHELARRQMRHFGPLLSIELASERQAQALPRALRLFRDATSLGGVESLAEWRRKVDPEAPPGLVRLAVGLEDPGDLERDLDRALAEVG